MLLWCRWLRGDTRCYAEGQDVDRQLENGEIVSSRRKIVSSRRAPGWKSSGRRRVGGSIAGCVASGKSVARGHLIRYNDGKRRWERLNEMKWRRSAGEVDAERVAKSEEAYAITILSQSSQRPVTRSKRHDVKVRFHTPIAAVPCATWLAVSS